MKKPAHRLQKTALSITRWVGSPASILAHTVVFAASFGAVWLQVLPFDRMLLILTTMVSLEAIYLAIFIQMTINVQSEALEEVEQDIDEIQEDIDEIQEDVEEIHEVEKKEEERDSREHQTIEQIHAGLTKLLADIDKLKQDR
jgi:peptidoglycan hydrolase CwlO-like protein